MKRWAGFSTATSAKFDQVHVRQNGTLTERDLRHEVVQCNHCNDSQFVRPVLNLSSATLACCVLFSCCQSNEVLRRTYGKDNRDLHTAKLSQGFKVVSPSRTWQGASISTGGTKIGVTGSETRTAKLRVSKVKQQSWARRRVA
jgi:hypothetical protein